MLLFWWVSSASVPQGQGFSFTSRDRQSPTHFKTGVGSSQAATGTELRDRPGASPQGTHRRRGQGLRGTLRPRSLRPRGHTLASPSPSVTHARALAPRVTFSRSLSFVVAACALCHMVVLLCPCTGPGGCFSSLAGVPGGGAARCPSVLLARVLGWLRLCG